MTDLHDQILMFSKQAFAEVKQQFDEDLFPIEYIFHDDASSPSDAVAVLEYPTLTPEGKQNAFMLGGALAGLTQADYVVMTSDAWFVDREDLSDLDGPIRDQPDRMECLHVTSLHRSGTVRITMTPYSTEGGFHFIEEKARDITFVFEDNMEHGMVEEILHAALIQGCAPLDPGSEVHHDAIRSLARILDRVGFDLLISTDLKTILDA